MTKENQKEFQQQSCRQVWLLWSNIEILSFQNMIGKIKMNFKTSKQTGLGALVRHWNTLLTSNFGKVHDAKPAII